MTTPNTPQQILEKFSQRAKLSPGLSEEEIAHFQKQLPGPLPDHIKTLLSYSAGFLLPSVGNVHFTGTDGFEFPNAFPGSLALLADGSGNYWVVDINLTNGAWGAIFFVCHDPPVLAIQAPGLDEFLLQILEPTESNPKNALKYVQKESLNRIWKDDPWLISMHEARSVQDPIVSRFANQLPENFRLADLRPREVGSGFSWGSAGPNTEVRRDGADLLFGVELKAPSFLKRILARTR